MKPPLATKPRPSRPALDDDAIRAAIQTQLRVRGRPTLSGELWVGVRHRLRDPRILLRRILALADAMVTEGLLVRTTSAAKKTRYELAPERPARKPR